MKNVIVLFLLFTFTNGFSQSNSSVSLVAKIGQVNLKPNETNFYESQSTEPEKSFSFGIVVNKFLNKEENLSLEYGLINQFSKFSGYAESTNDYGLGVVINSVDYKLKALDVLFPLKLKGHKKNWSISGGIFPTYHLNRHSNENHTTETSDGIFQSESNFNNCRALFDECFQSGKFSFLNDFEVQYTFEVSYEIKRMRFLVEYSNYLLRNKNQNNFSGFSTLDSIHNPFFFGNFGSTINFGTSFRIY